MNYKKAMMAILIAIIVLILVLIGYLLIHFAGNTGNTENDLTWEQFEAMTPEQQMEFQNSFNNNKDFEEWIKNARGEQISLPWENGGKAPSEYTWEEFEALTAEQQIKFQNSFKNYEDFEKWMNSVKDIRNDMDIPWENGGKAPSEYTWKEFEALTPEQQIEFQNSFENSEKFEEWMQEAEEASDVDLPSDIAKDPSEYTWKEFEALTPEQQIEFQKSFGSSEDFEKWMQDAINTDENASFGKDVFNVTWEEFEAMSMDEQMIFQNSFESIEEFDEWLQANKPK